jgi:hypothetical protein
MHCVVVLRIDASQQRVCVKQRPLYAYTIDFPIRLTVLSNIKADDILMLEEIKMAEKMVEKDAVVKVARHRLSVLEMAETLGNISEACRRGGMDRTSFYEWKQRFQTHGLERLKDMPPKRKRKTSR